MNGIHYSSASNEWATPQDLFDSLNSRYDFTLDPCSTDSNAKCERHFTIADRNKELRSDPNNLVLLCVKCHRFVNSKKNINKEFIGEEVRNDS